MRFDATISLGNLIALAAFTVAAFMAWLAYRSSERAAEASKQAAAVSQRDLVWRIDNLETWRKEHMLDSDARDSIIRKLDKICDFIERELRLRNIKWVRDPRTEKDE